LKALVVRLEIIKTVINDDRLKHWMVGSDGRITLMTTFEKMQEVNKWYFAHVVRPLWLQGFRKRGTFYLQKINLASSYSLALPWTD